MHTKRAGEGGDNGGKERERVGGSNPLWRSKLQLAAWSETIVFAVSTGGLCTVCISGCVYACAGQCVCVSVCTAVCVCVSVDSQVIRFISSCTEKCTPNTAT